MTQTLTNSSATQLLPAKIHPLVLVPGILGTWPPNRKGKLDPITYTYTNLVAALTAIGYVPGVSLFTFPYDWRARFEDTGQELKKEITRIRKLSPLTAAQKSSVQVDYSKVDILAHSMGGLLTRSYIESDNYGNDVARLFLVAVPNQGAIAAYYACQGGDTNKIGVPPKDTINMIGIMEFRESWNPIFKIMRVIELARGKYTTNLYDRMNNYVVSIREMMPVASKNYLYCDDNGAEKVYACGEAPGYPQNEFMETLNKPENLQRFGKLDEVWTLTSSGYQTLNRVQVEDKYGEVKPLYPFGRPLDQQPGSNYLPGDTVLTAQDGRLKLDEETLSRVKLHEYEINQEIGRPLNHVEIVGDPDAIRYILGCLVSPPESGPRPVDKSVWDGPLLNTYKANYRALFI